MNNCSEAQVFKQGMRYGLEIYDIWAYMPQFKTARQKYYPEKTPPNGK